MRFHIKKVICSCKIVVVVLGVIFLFSACSSTELEERCFPMSAVVGFHEGKVTYGLAFPKDDASGQGNTKGTEIKVPIVSGASFSECKTAYENRLNKEADYNHLKVFVIEEDLLEQPERYAEVLDHLAETEDFPRNTYVCVVDEVEELFEMEQNISQDLGTYLEEYLKKQEEKKDRLLTLGDLLDEKENQTFVLYLPYLEVEENFVEWKGYMNTSGKSWQESEIEGLD